LNEGAVVAELLRSFDSRGCGHGGQYDGRSSL